MVTVCVPRDLLAVDPFPIRLIQNGYKLRFFPTQRQEARLLQESDRARFVWNYMLAEIAAGRRSQEEFKDVSRLLKGIRLTPEIAWILEGEPTVQRERLKDLGKAYGLKKRGLANVPKFQQSRSGFTVRYAVKDGGRFVPGKSLVLPCLGELKICWTRRPIESPRFVTVSLESCGRYFVSFTVVEGIRIWPKGAATKHIGIDFGTSTLMTIAEATEDRIKPMVKVPNPNFTVFAASRIKTLQKALSIQKPGSSEWQAANRELSLAYAKIRNRREAFQQSLSTAMVWGSCLVAIETLDIQNGMMNKEKNQREHRINRSSAFADASISAFSRKLSYKAKRHRRTFVEVSSRSGSTRTCFYCGYNLGSIPCRIRKLMCPGCKRKLDRDWNAAKNIVWKGMLQHHKRVRPAVKPTLRLVQN